MSAFDIRGLEAALPLSAHLNIHDSRTVHLLPTDGKETVAERHDLNIDGLGPGERSFLDLSCVPERSVKLTLKFG